ncbi:hypothetical protein [Actinomadura atramentaria]|uniref:hypothetical protein n=1 Tax=Actinomadura atramentaria TaxID=1990 RepID=UPI0012FBFFD0|nr:hypothetical protein [Actinomadura atramentaria]
MSDDRRAERRAARARAITEAEVHPRWADRRARRALVGGAAAALALPWAATVVCWFLAPSTTAMVTTFVLCGLCAAAWIPIGSQIVTMTRGAAGAVPEEFLDERQRTELLRARTVAHRATLTLLLLTGLIVQLALPHDAMTPEVPAAAVAVLFVALLATVVALPALAAGWNMPDPPPDDDADSGSR